MKICRSGVVGPTKPKNDPQNQKMFLSILYYHSRENLKILNPHHFTYLVKGTMSSSEHGGVLTISICITDP